MSRLDPCLEHEFSSAGGLDRSQVTPEPSERDGTLNRRQSDKAGAAAPDAMSKAAPRRVVLVESDQYYRETLALELLRQGLIVHTFTDGVSLLGSVSTAINADLAVLDWDLPRMSGIKLLAELRGQGVDLPVVFLTGRFIRDSEHERLLLASREALNAYEYMAFDQGAVDFVSKSRDMQVLVRRLRNAIELVKSKVEVALEECVTCDELVLKPETSRAYWNHVDVGLTLGEYKIVHLLVSNAGSYVTYRAAYDRLHYEGFIAGIGEDGFRANVRSAIKRIRNKFRACDPNFDKIENYTGFGYCWRKTPG
jgi:two-component system, OmpR family, response regulator ChvI